MPFLPLAIPLTAVVITVSGVDSVVPLTPPKMTSMAIGPGASQLPDLALNTLEPPNLPRRQLLLLHLSATTSATIATNVANRLNLISTVAFVLQSRFLRGFKICRAHSHPFRHGHRPAFIIMSTDLFCPIAMVPCFLFQLQTLGPETGYEVVTALS